MFLVKQQPIEYLRSANLPTKSVIIPQTQVDTRYLNLDRQHEKEKRSEHHIQYS